MAGSDFATAGRTIIGPNVGQIRSAAINLSQLSNCLRLEKTMREFTHLILTGTLNGFCRTQCIIKIIIILRIRNTS